MANKLTQITYDYDTERFTPVIQGLRYRFYEKDNESLATATTSLDNIRIVWDKAPEIAP
jgi:hypothetical protein